jgi:hypothetical protein
LTPFERIRFGDRHGFLPYQISTAKLRNETFQIKGSPSQTSGSSAASMPYASSVASRSIHQRLLMVGSVRLEGKADQQFEVITCRSAAEARAALAAATRVLEQLGVRLNSHKTRIVHVAAWVRFSKISDCANERNT